MQGTIMHNHKQDALPNTELEQMSYLLKYLEDKWSIKKRNDAYILKQLNCTKITRTFQS